MLLAHNIPEQELIWFRDKGILIKQCESLHNVPIGINYSPIVLDKFYLFTAEFRQWKKIVFADADIIVRASLEKLTKIKGFAASDSTIKLKKQFCEGSTILNENDVQLKLNKRSFNSGFFAFSTDIISNNMFNEMNELLKKNIHLSLYGEEGIMNIYFYDKWSKIPRVYNLFISVLMANKLRYKYKSAIILHFINIIGQNEYKPWFPENYFYREWNKNLENSDMIDLSKTLTSEKWSDFKIRFNSFILDIDLFICHLTDFLRNSHLQKIRKTYFYILNKIEIITSCYIIGIPERAIGKVGMCLKKHHPGFYCKLRKLKGGK
jgi:lipopolysaccharide biosynthesis glycosyltransferase